MREEKGSGEVLVKCPKCELNYMEETDKICRVCFREIHGMDMPDEQEMCTICNEVPVMPGKVFCSICFREMNGEKVDDLETPSEDDEDEPIHSGAETVSTMDEIVPDLTDSDIPEPELREIDKDLSLEELEEKEDADEDGLDDDE